MTIRRNFSWMLAFAMLAALPPAVLRAEPDVYSASEGYGDYGEANLTAESALAPDQGEEYFISQPGTAIPSFSASPSTPAAEPRRTSTRSQYIRLARAPSMFGDSLSPSGGIIISPGEGGSGGFDEFTTDLPLGVGSVSKIAENSKALPMDRVYFTYNGFKNARTSSASSFFGPTRTTDGNIDRYTLGFEKTYFDGMASLEIRMPLVSGFNANFGGNPGLGSFGGLSSGNVGDLTLFGKQVLYIDDETVIAAGLGLSLPTASNVIGTVNFTPMHIDNGTVRLMPFIGFLSAPSDQFFVQGFFELDFTAKGNEIRLNNEYAGTLTPQHFLHTNLSVGRWIYENYDARYLQRIAVVGELHYSTAIEDADVVQFSNFGTFGSLGNQANRVDYLNLTAGLQFQIGPMSNLRIGGVVPLRTDDDRQFDSEIQVSFNRYF